MPTADAPWFDERYLGYGYNKMSFIASIAGWKYHLVVHPELFLVGIPHQRTAVSQEPWLDDGHWRLELTKHYRYMFKDMAFGISNGVNVYKPRRCQCYS